MGLSIVSSKATYAIQSMHHTEHQCLIITPGIAHSSSHTKMGSYKRLGTISSVWGFFAIHQPSSTTEMPRNGSLVIMLQQTQHSLLGVKKISRFIWHTFLKISEKVDL